MADAAHELRKLARWATAQVKRISKRRRISEDPEIAQIEFEWHDGQRDGLIAVAQEARRRAKKLEKIEEAERE